MGIRQRVQGTDSCTPCDTEKLSAPLIVGEIKEDDTTVVGLISTKVKVVEMRIGEEKKLHLHRGVVDSNGVFTVYIGDSEIVSGESLFFVGKCVDDIETEESVVRVSSRY